MEKNKELLWEKIRETSKSIETAMDPLERKRTGSYFTGLELTDIMMHELVGELLKSGKDIWTLRFLEPCVGAGNFVFSYLKEISKLDFEKEKIRILLDNLYVADINKVALEQYQSMLTEFSKVFFDIKLSKEYFETHVGFALLVDVTVDEPQYIKITDVFPESIVKNGFDIVVTNPPYKNLKAEKNQYYNNEQYEADKIKYQEISTLVNKRFKYSVEGVLNLYKIFVEEIIDNYINEDGYISLLIPASILAGKTCTKLRTHMLLDNNLISIKVIDEESGFIDARQALSTILLRKGSKTKKILVTKDFCNAPEQTTTIEIDEIANENTGNAIFALNAQEYSMLKQLRTFPIVKDLDFIINQRGELDLTANKDAILTKKTGYPLLRGRNIDYYNIHDFENREYVSEDFVNTTKKRTYIKSERIICQQVVNMNKERRVTFAYVPQNFVLGNSCNFIAVAPNEYNIDIYAVLGLFNTSVINWFFKLTSTNNHVNNYEIDCFPIPVHSPLLSQISKKVREYMETQDEALLENIENLAYQAYGIRETKEYNEMNNTDNLAEEYLAAMRKIIPDMNLEDAVGILAGDSSLEAVILQNGVDFDKYSRNVMGGITKKYIKIKRGEILNHITFKLSDLDMEMIKNVPPGGNWKDIPMETVGKSKRLQRINQTGGRTTLYGRIDYDKPSYTITTYFNRPGNGTYVHPVHDRVLSVREAARFQGFKDDYYFFGNKTQLLKQVGNAVPTILAYQIARDIVEKTDCKTSVDLFCGAGGMTAGFKAAGIKSILSNDIEESACITLKINNPEMEVFCGDITQKETKDYIVETAIKKQADIICGGPPCQGFSMAGLRLSDDPRNQLFKEFVEVVERVNPKIVVFENVEGLLSFQHGKVYEAILRLFSELGYKAKGKTLMANHYGVPQKRKRVIIICTRNDLQIEPADLFPKSITLNPHHQITARETIGDLEEVECGDKVQYIDGIESDIVKLFKGKMTYQEFVLNNTFVNADE